MVPRPPADPAKLLAAWMEWERGEATPGRVMANLKTGGLRALLEQLAGATKAAEADPRDPPSPAGTAAPAGISLPGGGSGTGPLPR